MQVAGVAPVVYAQCAGPKGYDLKEATCHHYVLEEVDHLVLVGEIAVKRNCRCQREDRQGPRNKASAITGDEKQAAAEFDSDSKGKGERRKGQSRSADHGSCCAIGGELAKTAHGERQGREDNGSCSLKVSLKWGFRLSGRAEQICGESRFFEIEMMEIHHCRIVDVEIAGF